MKRPLEALTDGGWVQDEGGWVLRPTASIEVRLEPLLFGGWYLAVYQENQFDANEYDLVGEKVPVSLGTPAHIRMADGTNP